MPKTSAIHAIALTILALVGAVTVGTWLGFGSCGGHVWHTYLGYSVLTLAVLTVATLGPGSLASRAGLSVLVVAAFLVARGAAFAAYLGAGSSSEYLREIGATFSSGLC